MKVEVLITADEKALEFSRNLGGIGEFFKEALMTNALEEHGIAARDVAAEENLKVEVPVEIKKDEPVQTVEPDPLPYDEAPVEDVSLEELQNMCVAFGDKHGKSAFAKIKRENGVVKLKDLDKAGRAKFAAAIRREDQ